MMRTFAMETLEKKGVSRAIVEPHYIELAYIEFPVISKSFPRPGQLCCDASISVISNFGYVEVISAVPWTSI
jgi:hypothetical protein